MPGDNLRYLTADEKVALALWRDRLEAVLAAGGAVYSELMFWLAPMGAVYSSGQLSFPASKYYTRAAPWTYIERYFNFAHARNQSSLYFNKSVATRTDNPYWNYTKYAGGAAYSSLIASYPRGSNILTVLNALYNRVNGVLLNNDALLRGSIPGYNRDVIIGGLLVLFETFAVWGTKYWATDAYWAPFYEGFSKTGTVGPYTVSVSYCNNGVVFGITMDLPYHTAHQSVDAELLIEDEERVTLRADEWLSADHPSDLDADIALRADVPADLDADIALRGEVQKTPLARIALRDEVTEEFTADELLAATHEFELAASTRLTAVPWTPLDADILVLGPATKTFAAYMLLLPDSASEILTDLEKYHIQKFRIRADPRSYVEFDSRKDEEVTP